ncbi:MAG: YjjG family noncanonical pyrimidine nucleotidase [Bacteroidaceae bacterium]|nr:YjjG family noncanonical pyrimidine nucleotidase [Bacteroidaceae bacterium]
MMEIKAVFMDVDDTLLDFNECARENIRSCMTRHGLHYDDSIFDFFLSRNVRLWEMIENRQLTVDELHRTRWANIFRDLDIHGDGVAFEQDFIIGLRETAVPMEGAHEIMEYLHSKYPVYVVSNASNLQQTTRLAKAGLMQYVDEVFGALDIGFNKPDPRYYDWCFEQLGGRIRPADVMIVGDSRNADIAGGNAYGLHTCWFDHRGTPADPGIVPEFTIHRLEELKSIL